MTYRGQVKNGIVVLEGTSSLPEGTIVRVEPVSPAPQDRGESVFDRLEKLAGTAKGLPPDLSRNHDHYLHGHPRR